jgi:hypothetical protein
MKIITFLLQLAISIIVGQTLFFKFSGAAESIYIFNTLGIEPWGRLGLASLELLAIVLLWIPSTTLYARLLILGMMSGAIASHLLVLGIEIMEDQGELFFLGVITWLASAVLIFFKREELGVILSRFLAKN